MTERAVGGTAIGTVAARASKAYKTNRVCGHEDCGTVLSIYNKGKYCYQHEPMVTPRTRGRKIA
jgi:hypothetical protein